MQLPLTWYLQSHSRPWRLEKGFCENAKRPYWGITWKKEKCREAIFGDHYQDLHWNEAEKSTAVFRQPCRNVLDSTAKTFVRTHYRCVLPHPNVTVFLDRTETVPSLDIFYLASMHNCQEVKFIQALGGTITHLGGAGYRPLCYIL